MKYALITLSMVLLCLVGCTSPTKTINGNIKSAGASYHAYQRTEEFYANSNLPDKDFMASQANQKKRYFLDYIQGAKDVLRGRIDTNLAQLSEGYRAGYNNSTEILAAY